MTTDILPTSPVWIGDRRVNIRFYAAVRKPGDPQTIFGTMTIEDTDGVLTLDALKGDQGVPGIPSPIIRPVWGHGYANAAALYAGEDDLVTADAGMAWYIGGYWYIWTGTQFRQEQGSLEGPPGPTPKLTMTAEVVEPAVGGPYGPITVEKTGTDLEPHLHLKVPGIPGPKGDNSTIAGSLDYDNTVSPLDGQGVIWDETKQKFVPGDLSPYAAQFWTIPQGSFANGNFNTGEQIITQLTIDAQPVAWWPDVSGHVRWRRNGILSSAAVQIEVRIEQLTGAPSVPGTAPIVALGPYDPSTLDTTTVTHISPHFSSEAEPNRAASPTSSVGRIPANQQVTVWVIARRVGGTGGFTIDAAWSQLAIRAYPVS